MQPVTNGYRVPQPRQRQVANNQRTERPLPGLLPPAVGAGFEDLAWLFQCDSRNRGIIRQSFDEAALLWKATKATRGNILEIGRNHAGSTALLAAASAGREMFSVDNAPKHHSACEQFLMQPGLKDRVHLLTRDSRAAIPGVRYGFLFIDGDHSYAGVLADVLAHWNALTVAPGEFALAAFHDALPNNSFAWREEGRRFNRRWIRLKNKIRRRQKEETARNYEVGVQRVCERLISVGCAEEWGRASSTLVLNKLRDLPPHFREDCGYPEA
jgi:hypothetical protein